MRRKGTQASSYSIRFSFRTRIDFLTAIAASSITYTSSGSQSEKTFCTSPSRWGLESCTLSDSSLSTLVCRALAIFTSAGRLILVEATSVWEMCWLVSPTISANCSCDSPAANRAARILCPSNL